MRQVFGLLLVAMLVRHQEGSQRRKTNPQSATGPSGSGRMNSRGPRVATGTITRGDHVAPSIGGYVQLSLDENEIENYAKMVGGSVCRKVHQLTEQESQDQFLVKLFKVRVSKRKLTGSAEYATFNEGNNVRLRITTNLGISADIHAQAGDIAPLERTVSLRLRENTKLILDTVFDRSMTHQGRVDDLWIDGRGFDMVAGIQPGTFDEVIWNAIQEPLKANLMTWFKSVLGLAHWNAWIEIDRMEKERSDRPVGVRRVPVKISSNYHIE